MLKRVFGQCNNHEIIFTYIQGGRWETVVPRDLSGVYYLDLYAEDEAGNIGFLATAVATYNAETLCYEFKLVDYVGVEKLNGFDIDDSKILKNFIDVFKCCEFSMQERSDCDWNLSEAK